MDNISSLPANCTSETYVKAALVKSFEDLDKALIRSGFSGFGGASGDPARHPGAL